MIIGIEAINLHHGGAKSHLLNILAHFKYEQHDIKKIIIWAKNDVLEKIPNYPWLLKKSSYFIDGNIFLRYLWLSFWSKREFSNNCDIVFAPSGLYMWRFRPYITMSRNMLLFDKKEQRNLNFKLKIKIKLSRYFHLKSLKNCLGVIFISDFAYKVTSHLFPSLIKNHIKINHGISNRFIVKNRNYLSKLDKPINILYLSHVYPYKYPWNVVKAAKILFDKGYKIVLHLVGGGGQDSVDKLTTVIEETDPSGRFVIYHGNQPYENIEKFYISADIFVFASTCENMPNILLEAMSSGLPIACSNADPMPEFLQDAGIYFDSLNIQEIANTLEALVCSSSLRKELGEKASSYASEFSWELTSKLTFDFIEQTYKNSNYNRHG